MVHIERSVLFHAPVQRVFAVVTNIPDTPQWVLMMTEATVDSSKPMAVGTTFVEKHELLGQSAVFEKVVTVYEAPYRYAVKSTSGPAAHTMAFTFEPVENSTRFSLAIDTELPVGLPGFLGLGDVLQSIAEEHMDGDLRRLKKIVEQPAYHAGTPV